VRNNYSVAQLESSIHRARHIREEWLHGTRAHLNHNARRVELSATLRRALICQVCKSGTLFQGLQEEHNILHQEMTANFFCEGVALSEVLHLLSETMRSSILPPIGDG
jgi:hypothetical protein